MSYSPPPGGPNDQNPQQPSGPPPGSVPQPPPGAPSFGTASGQQPGPPPAGSPAYGQQPAGPPPGSYGQQPGYSQAGQDQYGQQPGYPQAGQAQYGKQREGGGFFGAFFDFSFSRYVTLTFAKVIFIIAIVIAILWWLGIIISGFGAGALSSMADPYGRNDGGGAILGVLAILFGWIPPVLFLVAVRVSLEFVVATIKTSQNTAILAERD